LVVGQLTRLLSSVINSRACASIVSCEWLTNEAFLLGRLFPDRHVISVRPLAMCKRGGIPGIELVGGGVPEPFTEGGSIPI
jgi:hypothetical protein